MRIDANLEDRLTERLMTEKCRQMGHFSVINLSVKKPMGQCAAEETQFPISDEESTALIWHRIALLCFIRADSHDSR
jgi:hypothetical protein